MINILGPASCLSTPEGCFCEVFQPGAILQPVNTFTSLTFSALGAFLLFILLKRRKNAYQQLFLILFSLALLITGFGSAYYHARLNILGQTLDFLGMFMILLTGPLLSFSQVRQFEKPKTMILYCAVVITCLMLLLTFPEVRRYIFAIGVVLILVSEARYHLPQKRYFWSAFSLFLFSFLLWIPDNYRLLCFTQTNIQLHAAWHFLNTFACHFLFRYFYYKFER
jgi:hypothetical protein